MRTERVPTPAAQPAPAKESPTERGGEDLQTGHAEGGDERGVLAAWINGIKEEHHARESDDDGEAEGVHQLRRRVRRVPRDHVDDPQQEADVAQVECERTARGKRLGAKPCGQARLAHHELPRVAPRRHEEARQVHAKREQPQAQPVASQPRREVGQPARVECKGALGQEAEDQCGDATGH